MSQRGRVIHVRVSSYLRTRFLSVFVVVKIFLADQPSGGRGPGRFQTLEASLNWWIPSVTEARGDFEMGPPWYRTIGSALGVCGCLGRSTPRRCLTINKAFSWESASISVIMQSEKR